MGETGTETREEGGKLRGQRKRKQGTVHQQDPSRREQSKGKATPAQGAAISLLDSWSPWGHPHPPSVCCQPSARGNLSAGQITSLFGSKPWHAACLPQRTGSLMGVWRRDQCGSHVHKPSTPAAWIRIPALPFASCVTLTSHLTSLCLSFPICGVGSKWSQWQELSGFSYQGSDSKGF